MSYKPFKMKGFTPFHKNGNGVPRANTGVDKRSAQYKSKEESRQYLVAAEDELEWLNEDLFNDRISEAQYNAKAKILQLKINAARTALGYEDRRDPKWMNADEVD